ncbi:hypothetical protein PFMALIP_05844 [Plasmodium falciparum MaliPS096_E11]|uniref:Duffy-binding-like domain-containing protein n=1 Tax=Plasmodium falciparum MaliPS096_E11 TaxID=1036727 RepID=A0A024WHT7_PLAFA|nr:hypothetical protein PFMALIP_05844 [Plasmodium falciparum MaliPS096_E11]
MMQRSARKQLEEGGVGEIKLKGDASKGEYRNSGSAKDFKDVCSINENHSNRNNEYSKGPCAGKGTGTDTGTRFEIGTVWQPDDKNMREGHEDVLIPPRRRHMCTSNLEYLETKDTPLHGKGSGGVDIVNHSFLGDVLLSAKCEANNIKQMYKAKNNLNAQKEPEDPKHQATMCRAIRYSFADIGDIIRGRDIWDKEKGMEYAKGHLKTVFGNIRKSLTGKGVTKYESDTNHIKLREDWWEANRHQVWRAMKCAIEKDKNLKCNGIPIEDYIPQRLRWMTEFAEWYCNVKKKEHEVCKRRVIMINSVGNDYRGKPQKCDEYTKKIEEWKGQWTKLKREYSLLYAKAKVNAFKDDTDKSTFSVDKKDKPVYDFLLDLHLQNGGNVDPSSSTEPTPSTRSARTKRSINDTKTPYDNAGAYVNDTVDLSGYKDKINFCEGGRTLKDEQLDEAIVDEEDQPPSDVPPPAPATPEEGDEGEGEVEEVGPPEAPQEPGPKVDEVNVCSIVDGILKAVHGNRKVGDCNPKTEGTYPKWKCGDADLVTDDNVCMPPRRQKLCLFYVADRNEKEKIKTEDHLRDAFIKTAAAETFLAWHYYKSKNGNTQKLDEQLKEGQIPEEFLRSMYYTYGDYRDICLDSDISKKVRIVKDAKEKIDQIFPKKDDQTDHENRKNFWDENGPKIWEAMLCALEKIAGNKDALIKNIAYNYKTVKFSDNTTNLESFASRPQFLRWFIEWGDQFCREQKKELDILVKGCEKCDVSDIDGTCDKNGTGCKKCTKACGEYKKWISTWKEQYKKQKVKFQKEKRTYKDVPDVNNSKNAREYLNKNLEKICENGKCNYTCMKDPSSKNGRDMPDSLDENPKEVKDKCNCVPDECIGLSVKGSKIPDGHAFGGGGPPSYKCQGFKGGDSIPTNCVQKIAYDLWKKGKNETEYIEHLLKGDGMDLKENCKKLNINEGSEKSCDFNTRYRNVIDNLDGQCKDIVMKRLKTGEEWRCQYIKELKTNICIPPRREHMCIIEFKNIYSTDVMNNTKLLQIVQKIAKREGDIIIKKIVTRGPL